MRKERAFAAVFLASIAVSACAALIGLEHPRFDGDEDDGGREGGDGQASGDGSDEARSDADAAAEDAPMITDAAPISPDASLDGASPDGCPGDVACERVVFVTSTTVPSSAPFDGDNVCTTVAASSPLPRIKGRTFQSWTSIDGTKSPAQRFLRGTAPYIRPDGTVIAADWSALTSGTLSAAIVHDEKGNPIPFGYLWTGTNVDGTFLGPNCQGWSTASTGIKAQTGTIGATGSAWTASLREATCDQSLYLYCFER